MSAAAKHPGSSFRLEPLASPAIALWLPIFDQEILSVFAPNDADEFIQSVRKMISGKGPRRPPAQLLEFDAEAEIRLERVTGGVTRFVIFQYDRFRMFGGGVSYLTTEKTFIAFETAKMLADQMEEMVKEIRNGSPSDDDEAEFIEDGATPASNEAKFISEDEDANPTGVLH